MLISTPPKNWLLLLLLIIVWGTSFLQTSLSLRSFTPEQIVAARLCLAAIILVAYLFYKGEKLPTKLTDWSKFICFALLGYVFPFWLISTGQQTVTSGLAGLLMAVMPLLTMLLAHWLIPNELLTRYRIIGFGIGISGVLFVLWPSLISDNNSFIGALLVLLAACCYAFKTILVKRYSTYGAVSISTGVMICSALISLISWPDIWVVDWTAISSVSVISLIWLGIVPTGIAAIIYFVLVEQAGPTFLSNINYVIPVVAYISGALFLSETVSIYDFLALVFILSGIVISRLDPIRIAARKQL